MKKLNFEEFMIYNLRTIAENKNVNITRAVNTMVLQLFWKIGTIIQNDTDSNHNLLHDASNKLVPLFGGYMDISQLRLMKEFAHKYDSGSMDKVFDFPDWSEISISLDSISEASFSMLSAESPRAEMIRYCNNMALSYFVGKDSSKFRELFEPKEYLKQSTCDLSVKRFDSDGVNEIFNAILATQVGINDIVNSFFNSLLWEIGEGIIKSSSYFETSISDNTITYCIKELGESLPSIFNKEQILSCIKLARHYKTNDDFWNISDMISWAYLKVLLEINDIEKHIHIANQLLTKEIDFQIVKEHISKGSFDLLFDGYGTPKREDNYKLVKIVTEKEGQHTIIGHHYERTNRNHEYQRILNCNIFENKDLLEFLKDTVTPS